MCKLTNSLNTIHSLQHIYKQATADDMQQGLAWYKEAHNFAKQLAENSGYSLDVVCKVIALLSPGCSWEINKVDAETVIYSALDMLAGVDIKADDVSVSTYPLNRNKAFALLFNEIDMMGGNKVFNFYRNILNPHDADHVTIDRHAIKAAAGKDFHKGGAISVTHLQYKKAASLYKKLASKLNLIPCDLQAIIWVTYKRLNNV